MEIRDLIIMPDGNLLLKSAGYIFKDTIHYFLNINDIIECKSDHIYVDDLAIKKKIEAINDNFGDRLKDSIDKYRCFYTFDLFDNVRYLNKNENIPVYFGQIKYVDWLIKNILE